MTFVYAIFAFAPSIANARLEIVGVVGIIVKDFAALYLRLVVITTVRDTSSGDWDSRGDGEGSGQ
ncbi:MAG: hypothetical protein HY574_03890 [candidate division NC10 bacterium]|nr:hypothetical protein [candidate division NC10 bacterium]